MNVFPEEEPGANVLGSRQVAVVYLAVLESTQAIVVDLSAVFVVVDAVSVYLAGAVIGILRCTPCTDTGDTHPVTVRLKGHTVLDIILTPHMDAFPVLPSTDFSFGVKVFKDNTVYAVSDSYIHQGLRRCNGQLAVGFPYPSVNTPALLAGLLIHPLPVDHVVKTAFFTVKVDDTFIMDSTVGGHDTPGGSGIDAEVYGKDTISKSVFIRNQSLGFAESEPDTIPASHFINDR